MFKRLFSSKTKSIYPEIMGTEPFIDYLKSLEETRAETSAFWPLLDAKLIWIRAEDSLHSQFLLSDSELDQFDALLKTEHAGYIYYLLASRATYFPDIPFLPQYRLVSADDDFKHIITVGHLDKFPENWSFVNENSEGH